jgi:hypothetical protein
MLMVFWIASSPWRDGRKEIRKVGDGLGEGISILEIPNHRMTEGFVKE